MKIHTKAKITHIYSEFLDLQIIYLIPEHDIV